MSEIKSLNDDDDDSAARYIALDRDILLSHVDIVRQQSVLLDCVNDDTEIKGSPTSS